MYKQIILLNKTKTTRKSFSPILEAEKIKILKFELFTKNLIMFLTFYYQHL